MPELNGSLARPNNYAPSFNEDVITYPCPDLDTGLDNIC